MKCNFDLQYSKCYHLLFWKLDLDFTFAFYFNAIYRAKKRSKANISVATLLFGCIPKTCPLHSLTGQNKRGHIHQPNQSFISYYKTLCSLPASKSTVSRM